MYILGMLVAGAIGALIGRNKKIGPGWGFVLGLFLGFIGWIIVACCKRNETEFVDAN